MTFCTEFNSMRVMCDEEGKDYPSAPDLLMAALGSCTAAVITTFARRHDLPMAALEIRLEWEIAEKPHRIAYIRQTLTLPGALTEEQRKTLARVAGQCLIHNTLLHAPQIDLAIETKGSQRGRD
jgi:uncharacterized OsmC-like protein